MGVALIQAIPFTRVQTDTSGAIALNLNSRAVMFVASAVIAAPATITIGGGISLYSQIKFRFTLSALAALTLPINVRMSDPLFAGQVWTPVDTGEFELSGSFDGTYWNISIVGPYS
jgi:hypothetical protein